jgi:hypothetical protein
VQIVLLYDYFCFLFDKNIFGQQKSSSSNNIKIKYACREYIVYAKQEKIR